MAEASGVGSAVEVPRPPWSARVRRRIRRVFFAPLPRRWELRYRMWQNGRSYRKELAQAKARRADRDEIGALNSEWSFEFYQLLEEVEILETRRLTKKAQRRWVDDLIPPRPSWKDDPMEVEDENWAFSQNFGVWYMKPALKRRIRDALRAERRSSYEDLRQWAPTIISILTAIATIVGVLHAVKK